MNFFSQRFQFCSLFVKELKRRDAEASSKNTTTPCDFACVVTVTILFKYQVHTVRRGTSGHVTFPRRVIQNVMNDINC